MIIPAIKTPIQIPIIASLNFILRIEAAIEPVHAPVIGRGIPTKRASPRILYFSIIPVLLLVLSNNLWSSLPENLNFIKNFVIDSKKRSIGMAISILLMTQIIKALNTGNLKMVIAIGIPPLSSEIGSIDIIAATTGFASSDEISFSNILFY